VTFVRKVSLAICALVVLATACSSTPEAVPTEAPLNLSNDDLAGAVLETREVGDEWTKEKGPRPSTVQIGGRVGPANIEPTNAAATSAFVKKDASGYISNTVYLLQSETAARAVMDAHIEFDATNTWKQDRDDGGEASYERLGRVPGVTNLGDELYTARLKATIRTPSDESVERTIDYIAYRFGPLLAFVVTQDVEAGTFARRQESNVARLQG
jgi:hypothetical protein